MDSQWTPNGLTQDSNQIIENALVLSGCPRKVLFFSLVLNGCPRKVLFFFSFVLLDCPRKGLFFHWFYKVVREQCCFFNCFRRVVREKREKTFAKTLFFVDNPPGMVWAEEKQSTHFCLTTALASQSNRLSLAHTASPRPLARTNETKRFPVGGFTN